MAATPPAARCTALGVCAALLALAPGARASEAADKVAFSGFAQSDLRFEIEDYRGARPGDGYRFSTNRNDVDLQLALAPAKNLTALVEARARYFGFLAADSLVQTADRNVVDPFSLQLDQAWVALRNVPAKGVDLKIGRMTQTWGSVDMFSPVDLLSARDFSDPLDFTRKVPNQMLQADWYPKDWLSFTAVWVPIFKPSQLPDSAAFGFAIDRDAKGCLVAAPAPPLDKASSKKLADLFSSVDPCSLSFQDPSIRLVLPDATLADSQAALRAKLKLGDLDLALSYYYGRFTFPVAYTAVARTSPSAADPSKVDVAYTAEVMYPRMQVAGLDFAYASESFFDIGLRGELAVIFPEEVDFAMRAYQGTQQLLALSSVNVPRTPFVKATLGAEYQFTPWLMASAMYVHGFFDEFNDAYGLHNYVVVVPRLSLAGDSLKLQISAVLDATDLSNQENPELVWVPVPGAELSLGGWWFGGSIHPKDPLDYASREKFGQRAAGRSVAYLRAKTTW